GRTPDPRPPERRTARPGPWPPRRDTRRRAAAGGVDRGGGQPYTQGAALAGILERSQYCQKVVSDLGPGHAQGTGSVAVDRDSARPRPWHWATAWCGCPRFLLASTRCASPGTGGRRMARPRTVPPRPCRYPPFRAVEVFVRTQRSPRAPLPRWMRARALRIHTRAP